MVRGSSVTARLVGTLLLLAGCPANISFPPPTLGPCDRSNGGCDVNAICSVATNATTATCVCKPGFEGNGKTCTPAPDAGADAGAVDAGISPDGALDGGVDGGLPDGGLPGADFSDADISDAAVDGG